MSASNFNQKAEKIEEDIHEQLRNLRAQVSSLLERTPGLVADGMRQARDVASHQAEAVAGQVREQPLIAVLVAAAVGFVLGRISR
jgi:ElaB/YqjD/DUF883 family membrane-anchored ribosome-binding protein